MLYPEQPKYFAVFRFLLDQLDDLCAAALTRDAR